MQIEDMYNEIITENSRSPRNRRHINAPTASAKGVNPSCGDEISLEVRLDDGIIADAAYTGEGCAISQASASIMIDLVKGKTVEQARAITERFLGMIKGSVTSQEDLEQLEEAVALQGIRQMPARVKCAVLSWHTLLQFLS